jgi:hypothetical protein
MEDFKKRVVEEKKDLDVKITKLAGFLFSEKSAIVVKEEYDRMETQMRCMMNYSRCLGERIAYF